MYKVIFFSFLILSCFSCSLSKEFEERSVIEKTAIQGPFEDFSLKDIKQKNIAIIEIKDFVQGLELDYLPEYANEPEYFRKVAFRKNTAAEDGKVYIFYDTIKPDGLFDLFVIRDYSGEDIYRSEFVLNDEYNAKLNSLISINTEKVIQLLIESVKNNQADIFVISSLLLVRSDRTILEVGRNRAGYVIQLADLSGLSIISMGHNSLLYDKFVFFIDWIKNYPEDNYKTKCFFDDL